MKAIPTKYNNHFFRSRLEARWAVYFDALSAKWVYEPEGYELPDGSRYLPDFFLPDHKMYAEVKPDYCFDNRWLLFVKGGLGPLVILDGIPAIRNYRLYETSSKDKDEHRDIFLIAPGCKYFPWYDGLVGELFGDGDQYSEAVELACSARFE
jgi:hypothetical protein